MYLSVDRQNTEQIDLSSLRILLAESDSSKIERVRSHVGQDFQATIRVCKNYYDLLPMLREELPEILLLGLLDKFNCFDVCQECHQTWQQLPIFLLSRQSSIDNSFLQIAIAKGATDIITNDLAQLDRVLQRLSPIGSKNSQTAISSLSVQAILAGLKEITAVSSIYFGTLAQGNYWRKAHASIVDEFPALQNWSADHFGTIACNDIKRQSQFTTEDLQSLRRWIGAFISECQRIIVDFGKILHNSQLSPVAIQLLPDLV